MLKAHQTNIVKKPFKEYCVARQITKLVADRCHTQTNCSIQAQFNQFQLPECENDLTNDELQTQVHLKVAYACVQNEVLRSNLITNNNNIGNTITNTFNTASERSRNQRPTSSTSSKTKDSPLTSLLNELNTSTQTSISQQQNKPEFTDLLDTNLLPSTEYSNNRNTLFDQTVHPTENDNPPPAAVRSNEQQSSWPNQIINELPTDFKTHISNGPNNHLKSSEPFKDWSSFCQYIESELLLFLKF